MMEFILMGWVGFGWVEDVIDEYVGEVSTINGWL